MNADYESVISGPLSEFHKAREAAGRTGEIDYKNLKYFDRHCATFNGGACLTQEMVDGWLQKRDTESNCSCNNRTRVVKQFLRWTNERGITDISIPENLPCNKSGFVPHHFTQEELVKFFEECDAYEPRWRQNLAGKIAKLEVPMIYRLLYSTGMRTCEARNLRRCEVDLSEGVIDINESKGPDGHRVALHETARALLVDYDNAMDRLMPNRIYLFPDEHDRPRRRYWLSSIFNRLWSKCSDAEARVYDLRANYATTNINSWNDEGMEWHWKLACLSKSMGHRHLGSTAHYYSITPYLYNELDKITSGWLDDCTPEYPLFNDEEE